ncbi:Predicted DNA-binding transcriptional regulator YafY, contains an HTH and WYL domains [Chitinophaga niabensis]|uniref:Predicted DNA-binding transcriptional regulator YafY, contains an HTH and WYL domains n=2 Tax=Chitinophaga niabensis TaxID=536979 RepID=A0A1N6D688_9BACT|nr:Predicted DNA-binding transcriptional regulator YafY, contains an HTH and WYL domains [Chitinophaga niabensis]
MMKRFDRLTAILIHLQSKKLVVAQEIADRFEISLRTVYRDIRSLELAGVPILGEKGLGYSIMEGYRLPPVMFTEEEVIAFLMAEKILENHADLQNSERFKSAMFKVRAILRNAQKKVLEDMEESIAIKHNKSEHNFLVNDTLPLLIKAVSEKITLRANYATEEGPVERDIEPIGIFHENGTWNAIAYCHLLKDYRHFRVERILSLSQTNKSFHKQHKTLAAYLEKAKEKEQVFPAVIDVDNFMVRYLQEQKFDYGFKSEKPGKTHTRMFFDAPCIQAFSRWYVTFADHAKIIEPASLKDLLKERLTNLLKVI